MRQIQTVTCRLVAAFLDADWPTPVLLPIRIDQSDVPNNSKGRVLDFETPLSVVDAEA